MIKNIKKEQLLIVALAGILLLVIAIPVPEAKKEESVEIAEPAHSEVVQESESTLEEALEEILQKIAGVGLVEVLITYEDHGKIVVEKDESFSEESIEETDSQGGRRTTITAKNERETVYENEKSPYVVQEFSPVVKGVLVVAQGGANETVKKQIRETIEALFGLDAHKISIMKMEVSR